MSVMQKMKAFLLKKITIEEKDIYDFLEKLMTKNDSPIYVGTILKIAAERHPQRIALTFCKKNVTYKELYFRSVLLSKKLKQLGVNSGDKVLLLFENSIEFYIAYFAILQVGAVCVPLNVFLHEKELISIINDCKPVAAIVSSTLKVKFDNIQDLNQENVLQVLTEKDIDFDSLLNDDSWVKCLNFELNTLAEKDLCLLLYTSGSTGTPKGVMLSSQNVLTNVRQAIARLAMYSNIKEKLLENSGLLSEKFFAALPLFHVFAQNTCIWFPILVGGTIIVVPKIDRKEILEGLREKPTIFFGVPALYGLLCLMKSAPIESVRLFVSGGDAMNDKIRCAFSMIYGRKICVGYGLTEASPVVAINIIDRETSANVVGKLLANIKAEIRDDNDKILGVGEVGILWLLGNNVMLGYYNSPTETNRILKDGWLNTGDLAKFDKFGNLEIIGRTKDLIIHKGFNIYPQEVENVLLTHPAISKVAVVGRDDTTTGQVPVAFIAIKPGNDEAKLKLKEYCGSYLAAYKVPRKFIYLDDLPMGSTGKVDKKKLLKYF